MLSTGKNLAHLLADDYDIRETLSEKTIDFFGKYVGLAGGVGVMGAEGMAGIDVAEWIKWVTLVGGATLIIDRMIRLGFFIIQKKRELKAEKNGRNDNDK